MTDTQLRATRRTLVRGAAWSVPVVSIAAAAPAFAASSCKQTLVWATLGAGNTFTSTTIAGITITLTVSGDTGAANNRTISTTPTGGRSSNLRFYSGSAANSSQTATFSFTKGGQPVNVTNLSFTFLDIDSGTNGNGSFAWFDRVVVGATPSSTAITSTTYVQGDGLATATAFRPTGPNTSPNTAGSQTNGNVGVTWAAALSSIAFTYSQGGAAPGSPFIGISDMTFNAEVC